MGGEARRRAKVHLTWASQSQSFEGAGMSDSLPEHRPNKDFARSRGHCLPRTRGASWSRALARSGRPGCSRPTRHRCAARRSACLARSPLPGPSPSQVRSPLRDGRLQGRSAARNRGRSAGQTSVRSFRVTGNAAHESTNSLASIASALAGALLILDGCSSADHSDAVGCVAAVIWSSRATSIACRISKGICGAPKQVLSKPGRTGRQFTCLKMKLCKRGGLHDDCGEGGSSVRGFQFTNACVSHIVTLLQTMAALEAGDGIRR